MGVALPDLLADLRAETDVVTTMLACVTEESWETPTPADGWAIRDQVSHLAYFDQAATQAVTESDRFREAAAELLASGDGFPDRIAERYRYLTPTELSEWLATARRDLLDTFASLDPKTRVPWYGPDMSVTSSATARLMETWAHGQDIADTLGVVREPTHRLRHVAELGIRTFGFAFTLHGRELPDARVRVELTAPDGEIWSWGPDDGVNRVSGTALDFCLAVTQRRHRNDTDLMIRGPVAHEWMSIAQAFAGAPGPGRAPGAVRKEATR